MVQTKIEKLTPEQEALIPFYYEKWKAIALSPGPINLQKATEAVKAAYAATGLKEPDVFFFDSPDAALRELRSQLGSQPGSHLYSLLDSHRGGQMRLLLDSQPGHQLYRLLYNQLYTQMWSIVSNLRNQLSDLRSQLDSLVRSQLDNPIRPEIWACNGSLLDFCSSVLNFIHDQRKWEAFQSLVKECGWIFPFEKIAIVCDRPIKLSFDSERRLHAEGEPGLQFADGYSVYAYHGVTLPEKYGKLHPTLWQSQWLLQEDNAELRRVLIQGIGYGRICQELQATVLDSWAEYTLLKIDNADVEPIYLLKMTCPSTGFIHASRVPPNMKSAKEAIHWVNWGVNPEDFSVQT